MKYSQMEEILNDNKLDKIEQLAFLKESGQSKGRPNIMF